MAQNDGRPDPDGPLRFTNEQKIRRQMQSRKWTEPEIREALRTDPINAVGKKGAAMRFVHPLSGKSIVVDAATGEIFHVGKETYKYG